MMKKGVFKAISILFVIAITSCSEGFSFTFYRPYKSSYSFSLDCGCSTSGEGEGCSSYNCDSFSSTETECPLYYEEHLRQKTYTLQKIEEQNEIDFSFAFITDLHWTSNIKNSPFLVKNILNVMPLDKVVLGGDYINDDYENVDRAKEIMNDCASSFSFTNYTAIVGNHDSNRWYGGETTRIPDEEIFSIMNKKESDVPYSAELYSDKKICSLYLNSSTGSFGSDDAQKDFIYNTLSALDSSWYVVAFVHILFDGSYKNNNLSVLQPAGKAFLDYFDSIKSELSCNFVGVFSGHSHLDYLDTTSFCFPVVTTMCDSLGAYNPRYNIYIREENTFTEQTFDVVQINTSLRKVYLTRIGAGVDRSFSF